MRLGDSVLPNISALWFVDCADPAAELRSGVYIDPARTMDLMERAFADNEVTPIGTADLASAADSAENRVFAAHFGRLAVIGGTSLHTADPTELSSYLTDLGFGESWVLISLDPTSDTGCFARWSRGDLQRAFAGTSTRIGEDTGLPYPFERPFWAGERPQSHETHDPLALPFHPGWLADAAQRTWFGFGFGDTDEGSVDPTQIPVTVYRIGPDDGFDNIIETSVSLRRTTASAESSTPGTSEQEAETEPGPSVVPELVSAVVPGTGESEAEQTAPIEPVSDSPAPKAGPISRYFGFRGRL
ncbi:DUF6928 family protein [Gordonia sp. (in: high G+C Gram-positive bacteria)]|uniref:DUF6928 family protein n=1 Tax=Gordonia sp. (in: high G+C Gram-positive bacteria) TaxID=84139 RepID=UPI003C729BDF